jgi:hypothetical protein
MIGFSTDCINRKGYEAGDWIIQYMKLFVWLWQSNQSIWGERENSLCLFGLAMSIIIIDGE